MQNRNNSGTRTNLFFTKAQSYVFGFKAFILNFLTLNLRFGLLSTKLRSLFQLPKTEEEIATYEEIKAGVFFKGQNLWLLVLAMCIACVGLNTNNTAAVIGAMLISPLMGPIVGLGFGFGIGSRNMVRISIYNWMIMVATSLLASSLYFILSPFDFATDQLNSFKEGSIFDVLIAFFGGLAGFLGITRRESIKVIAGVAVSTSCMAPLCTAGYGLATGQWPYFAGGLYVFSINCFFVGLGTFILTIVLGYREAFIKEQKYKGKGTGWLILTSLLLIGPSVWLATQKWKRETLNRASKLYVAELQATFPELVIIQNESFTKNDTDYISLSVLNDSASLPEGLRHSAQEKSKDLQVIWHFTPNKAQNELQFLQLKIEKMEWRIRTQDSLLSIFVDSLLPK